MYTEHQYCTYQCDDILQKAYLTKCKSICRQLVSIGYYYFFQSKMGKVI